MTQAIYDHIQRGKLVPLAGAFLAAGVAIIALARDDLGVLGIFAVVAVVTLVAVIIVIASVMRVAVTEDAVTVTFGRGWPRKVIPRSDIVALRPVRNHWILGWGIRWFPGGWMWNVWGLDSVELELVSGRRFRIGSDDVDGLTMALQR